MISNLTEFPHSGATSFLETVSSLTIQNSEHADNRVADIKLDSLAANAERDESSCGLYLCDPAVVLKRQYDSLKKTGEINVSFQAFYQSSEHQNRLSTCLNVNSLQSYAFVAVEEEYLKSCMLFSQCMGLQYSQMAYAEISTAKNRPRIAQADRQIIRKLNPADYALYDAACAMLLTRWQQYLAAGALQLRPEKKIIIHLGPPKTGTSAIQYWLNKNKAKLEENNVFYPEHNVDRNFISSGNYECVISRTQDNQFTYVDLAKLSALVNEFNRSNKRTLLLSSEYYFFHLPLLFRYLPDATFVFYVRHPLATLESSYHQQVKRHKRTTDVGKVREARFLQLDVLRQLLTSFNVNFNFRYFESSLFEGGTIIHDFCDAIDLPPPEEKSDQIINKRYTLGCLELMRLCNGFASDEVLLRLDNFLQHYSESRPTATLFSHEFCLSLKASSRAHAELLCGSIPSLDKSKLERLIDAHTSDAMSEGESTKDVPGVLSRLKEENILLAEQLRQELVISDSAQSDKYSQLKEGLDLSVGDRARLYYKLSSQVLVGGLNRLKAVVRGGF